MRKIDEMSKADGTLGKSRDDEWLFVLCARDPLAPAVVRKWADDYESVGGRPEKVAEARACADRMEEWRRGGAQPGERSTSEYTPEEIAIARAVDKLRVDDNGCGWIRGMDPASVTNSGTAAVKQRSGA